MPRLPIGASTVAAASLLGAALVQPASVAATAAYGDSMVVSFGVNEHSSVPVDLTLPAPGDGRSVAEVKFRWLQNVPTYQGTSTGTFVVQTPHCVVDAPCEVHADVPTARMRNSVMSSVSVIASDGSATIGSTSRTLNIQNPKPTVAFTAPGKYSTFWDEDVALTAEATPSSSGAPIKAVRFYVNPRSEEDFPYLEDTTAPYAVDVPTSEIAESTRTGTLYVVAEDVEGNLSQYSVDGLKPFLRYVSVGPPPIVSWRTPAVDGRPAGGMSTQALLRWDTALPETAPPSEGDPDWPYLERIEIFRDGVLLSDRRWDETPVWGSDFGGRNKVRTEESYVRWTASSGMTPGEHSMTVRVTSSYGSVGTATRRFVVTDGVMLGRVMSRGRVVRDGHIVTAGTTVPLRFDVAGKVPGSAIGYYDILLGEESLLEAPGCRLALWWDCPEHVTVKADWWVPTVPGRYTLTFAGREQFDSEVTSRTRTFRVQPAGHVRAGVSSDEVASGERVAVRGRVVRTDTGRGVRGVPVVLRWRKAGTSRWVEVAERTSRLHGRVRAISVRRRTGVYRWVSPGDPGRIGPARSKVLRVTVRR